MTNTFFINMSLNLRRTKVFFLTFAILSFVIIFVSYNWNIPENIYKISSEISKVRISELHLSDIEIKENTLKSYTRGVPRKLTTKFVTNKSTQTETEIKRMNYTNINVVESKTKDENDDKKTTTDVQKTGNKVQEFENENIKSSTESQGNKPIFNQDTTKNYNQTLKVKEKAVNSQKIDNQNKTSTSALPNTAKDDTQNTISNGNYQNMILNKTKNTFQKIQNSKAETKEVLREIHKLKDEILSDHKSYKPQRSRYHVLRKNNSNKLKTERDFLAFHRIRNRLKQLGRANNGLIMPIQNNGFDFNNNNIDSDVTSRPDACAGCFERNFKKMINEPTLCDGDVDLLFMIASTYSRMDSRNAIRNTWCGQCNKPDSKMKMVFVFGNRNDTIENINLLAESRHYHDIIQLDFHDTYANLTYKTITSLQWSEDYCKKANYVMKTDDDMYVNTELLPLMLKAAPSKNLIGGMCWGPSSPHRDLNSKWYVSFVQYRHSFFPSMCSGTGYVMSRDVVSGILQESPNVPFFYLEDVYVAICVKRLGVTPLLLDGFKNQRVNFEPCFYRNRIITAHEMSADSLNDIWDKSRTCPKEDLRPEMVYRPFPV